MDRLITLLCAMILAGAVAVWAVAYHPPIHYKVLFWSISLPDSLSTQRDAALRASQMAQDARNACLVSLDVQTAKVAQAAEKGALALASARSDLEHNQSINTDLLARRAKLKAVALPQAAGSCPRWEAADDEVKEALR